jgi:estrogen-related receptor beta like 1
MSEGGYVPSGAEQARQAQAQQAQKKEGESCVAYLLMEDVADKLRLMEYETKFCKVFMRGALRPLRPAHFAVIAQNPAEQFYYFTQLVVWLMNCCNRRVAAPSRTDDPNATTATLIDEMKKMGLPTDFPPNRMKQGYGDVVCGVLNELLKVALATTGFRFEAPTHTAPAKPDAAATSKEGESGDDDGELMDEAEAEGEELVDETAEYDSEDDMAPGAAKVGDVHDGGGGAPSSSGTATDPAQWKLEVERVTPQLRVQVVQDSKDWRMRRDEIQRNHETIAAQLATVRPMLEKMSGDLAKELEKIATHERFLNEQFEGLVTEHRVAQDSLAKVAAQHKIASERVMGLTKELAGIMDELAAVKDETEALSTAVNDSSPVLRMKAALARLKEETQTMEVRIGVAQHTILRAMLRENQRSLKTTATAVSSSSMLGSPGARGGGGRGDFGLNAARLGMTGILEGLEEDSEVAVLTNADI